MWNDPGITRRHFLTGFGATTAAALVGGLTLSVWRRDPGGAGPAGSAVVPPLEEFGTAATGRTLVIVEMGGGNDGLNTVVPYADPAYHDRRPNLAIDEPIELDRDIGLHPSLPFLAEEYAAGRLAIVEGVGYPNPNLSHFESMATWWTAKAPGDGDGRTGDAGWLGRMLDGTVGYENPLAGIAIGPGPSQALLGNGSFVVSIQDHGGLQPNVPPWIDDVEELLASWSGFAPAEVLAPSDLTSLVHQSMAATAEARSELQAALAGAAPDASSFPNRTSFVSQMSVAARLVTSGLAPQVVYVHGFGDYDTHSNQANRHAQELTTIDEGLRSFFSELAKGGATDNVVIVTTSEFGRRPRENSSGTDHGTASALFAVGSEVSGGRYGQSPSLTTLDETSNLVHTVDFRSVYATLLDSWLRVDADGILGAGYERLDFL